MRHALLVEFATINRFHRGITMPFVRGHLQNRGVPSRWLRFGLDADARAAQHEKGVALCEGDLRRAIDAARQDRSSHVLCSHEPAPSVVAEFFRQLPGVRIGYLDDTGQPAFQGSSDLAQVRSDTADVDAFLGLDVQPGVAPNLFDQVVPDFAWEAANDAAATAPPLPFLVVGEECNYRRGLAGNPAFTGVDLSTCGRSHGCAFCVRPAERAKWEHRPVDLFRSQLEALKRTHPMWEGRLAIRAVGEPVLRNVEQVVEALLHAELPPVGLLLDGRADTIAKCGPALRAALERLEGSQHAIHMALVGVESFVDDELLRMNKGLTWRENLAAVKTLFELEYDHPDKFAFRDHGGLSLLLFTPWTRPQDLALNLAIVNRCKLLQLCGKVFTSRLRLYPSLPLHALAARDGLLIDKYDDAFLDTARRNFYPDEVPWRFRDVGMEPISRVLLRLEGTPDPSDVALSSALDALHARTRGAHDGLLVAESIVDAAIAHPDATPLQLARDAAAFLPMSASGRPDERGPQQDRDGPPDGESQTSMLLLAFEIGVKPVVRVEQTEVDGSEYDEAQLRRVAPVVRIRSIEGERGGRREIFVGRDAHEVEEAIRYTDLMDRARNDEEWLDSAREVGVLLGYPRCCVEAYTRHPPALCENYMWLYLISRLEAPKEVSHLLNPGQEQLVNYIPCSLTCEPTLHRARRLWDAFRERYGEARASYLERQLRNPWVLFLDRQGAAVELATDDDPTSRFRYHAGAVRGCHPLLARVAEGDEMVVDDQQLFVLRKGKLHAALGGRAFLWWYRAPVQADFWKAMVGLRFGVRRVDVDPRAHPDTEEAPSGAVATRLAALLRRSLAVGTDRPAQFHGYRATQIKPLRHDEVQLTLESGEQRVRVNLAPRSPGRAAYALAGPLAVFYPEGEVIDRPEKDRAIRALATALAEGFRKRRDRKQR